MRYARYYVIAAALGFLTTAVWPYGVSADPAKDTCASKHPNAPTSPPSGYDYKSETDAWMALFRMARNAGFEVVKKGRRDQANRGPCVGYGEHVNVNGAKANSKGKKDEMDNIGALTSCKICEDTARGPKLNNIVWRVHKKF